MAKVFFSYSHKDEELRDKLEVHLAALKRQGAITTYHDRCIKAGQQFGTAIDQAVNEYDVILLLISADFLASDYCWNLEMTRALERAKAKEAVVIPVILRPCDWLRTELSALNAAPKDGKPVTSWPDLDAAFAEVTQMIAAALPDIKKPATSMAKATAQPVIRSSNLNVKKQFSDLDRHQFLDEAFAYVAKFFANSVDELASRYPDIKGKVKQIDAEKFSVQIYRNEKEVSRCGIWVGDHAGWGGHAISFGEDMSFQSRNDWLSVDVDDQSMHLKAVSFSGMERAKDGKLTMQGAAEYLWAKLMAPLQR